MAHFNCQPAPRVFLLRGEGSDPHRKRLSGLGLFGFRACLILSGLILAACGGGSLSPSAKAVNISASPSTATIVSGKTQQFTATVSNSTNTGVTWAASSGTVSASGLFTAPTVASSIQISVTATSQADSSQKATVTLTVNPVAVVTSSPVPPAPVPPAAPIQHAVSPAWQGTTSAKVISFSLYRSTISGSSYGLLASALGTAAYNDQSVQSGTIYYYVVTAVDDQGRESAFSNETRATVP
jgi:hypothetical protein